MKTTIDNRYKKHADIAEKSKHIPVHYTLFLPPYIHKQSLELCQR